MKRTVAAVIAGLATLLALAAAPALAAETAFPIQELKHHTHIHGLAVDRTNTDRLLIATHHGIFRAGPDGMAERISPVKDFMGFTPHPDEPETYFGSGHPAEGGNLGFIVSTDGGASWQQRSPGVHGPVDFHQMAVSPVDPDVIHGAYGALQRSEDGGHEWEVVGPLPADLISLAASARAVDTLYAGTRTGLLVSHDGGQSWQALIDGPPVSMVIASGEGRLLAFIPGHGLIRADEAGYDIATLARDWGDHVLLHMAIDPNEPERMFAASHHGDIFTSADGGETWMPMEGPSE
jgi:photosystem II stability/assembly factor-like uncharacterized protein